MSETETSASKIVIARDLSGVTRYYNRALAAAWDINEDLPWTELPPVPEPRPGLPAHRRRERKGIWRSVVGQQLQADQLAIIMAEELYGAAPDPEAQDYYSTLVDDETRHTEAWLMLTKLVGEASDRDPYLDELVRMVREADTVEEKIFLMQVFFERAIIGRFNEIIKRAEGTVLAALCQKLKIDDGIHHGAGVAYEQALLANGSKRQKSKIGKIAAQAFPVFAGHVLWRPQERKRVSRLMRKEDISRIIYEANRGIVDAEKLGVDMGHISVAEVIDQVAD
jgi:hypothetical protein